VQEATVAETSAIEWCDSTFNPWIGCTRISPACDHCYAAAEWDDRRHRVTWGGERSSTSASNWQQPRRWQKQAAAFFAEHGRRRRVFCSSLADVFDNQVPTEWRDDLWALIYDCPDLDWLLLTKRPQNIAKMLPAFWEHVRGHIWLGTTVEDQKRADINIPHLLQHDAAVRFVSCEPLLGPIDLTAIDIDGESQINAIGGDTWEELKEIWRDSSPDWQGEFADWYDVDFEAAVGPSHRTIDWVIAGGESGPQARPSHPDWFRSLRDQCAAADVPFLFKQWGEWVSVSEVEGPGRHHHFDNGATVRRTGKLRSGRRLDGVEYNGFPEVHHG
jgi:protein gp37